MHFRSPSPVSIPWNPSGKELPTFCTVNDLEDTDVGVQALTVSGMFLLSLSSSFPLMLSPGILLFVRG